MSQLGSVRIIGGKWRGRRLVIPTDFIRPTPDRIRETVFNWLAPIISGAHCLDLFTGSGVLGFEALSRGAQYLEMVDQSLEVVNAIRATLQRFKVDNARVYQAQLPDQLHGAEQRFDIVFIDPPYKQNLLLPTCNFLETHQYLASPAYLFLEAERLIHENELPHNWQLMKAKQAGQVAYHLAKRMLIAESTERIET
jgi:16S rRNA (guanine966-N2)-methyltransferase